MKAKRACFGFGRGHGRPGAEGRGAGRPDREGLQIARCSWRPATPEIGAGLARLSPPEGQPGGGSRADVQSQVAVRDPAVRHRRRDGIAAGRAPFAIVTQGELELAAEIRPALFIGLGRAATTVKIIGVPEMTGGSGLLCLHRPDHPARPDLHLARRQFASAYGHLRSCHHRRHAALRRRHSVFGGALRTDGASSRWCATRHRTHRVALGLQAGGTVEAREGINEGDMVVARAGSFVREGDRVRPILVDDAARK